MKTLKLVALSSAAVFGLGGLGATPAQAQATRTWVSGVGDDANPCSRTAPCKTFAGTISKTAPGGEINCLDPGSFGTVTITKSITIDCTSNFSGQTASTTNGITINDSATATPGTIRVVLRGLSITGAPTALPGNLGIRFLTGASLILVDSIIQDFNGASPNGFGVQFVPTTAAELFISNTQIVNNGIGATGGGININPSGANGSARVKLSNVHVLNNANTGLRVDSTGNTNATGISVAIENSKFDGNGSGIAVVHAVGTNTIGVMLTDSSVSNNTGAGILGNGSGVTMRVGNTTITGNASGVTAAGSSTINTYGNNRLIGNPTVGAANNGAFSGAAIPEQ